MTPEIDGIELVRLPGAVPAWRASVDANAWLAACAAVARGGGRLGALWASDERDRGSGFTLRALLVAYEGLICLELPLPPQAPEYPDLAPVFPCAARMQRAAYDLLGVRAAAPDGRTTDTRGWLRHGAWQPDAFPLRRDVPLATRLPAGDARYAFVTVEGDGVHEIPVGPVHAGTIEPGHFRFSIVGERVLRLEQRLGYKHKGVEKRFESMTLADGARRPLTAFAGRRVDAIAAIGNPERFFAMLREYGLQVDEHALPDHATIAPESFRGAVTQPVLMTEKDAVKCQVRPLNAWYVEVEARVDGPAVAGLLDRITRLARAGQEGN